MNLVLDTNIVLDCWVFKDPAAQCLVTAIESQRAMPIVHRYALDELERVLSYPQCRLDSAGRRAVLDAYTAFATPAALPEDFAPTQLRVPPGFPACRDPDDDPFVALAFHAQATLVSKDRAVLKLRRKAKKFGVAICSLQDLAL